MAASGDSAGRSADPRRQAPPAARSGGQHGIETVPAGGTGAPLPEQFGPYRIKRKLGGGGMGAVYLVENTALGREEALKVPHFDAGDGDAVRQRFLQEARAAAGLRHANLCPVYHVGEQDGVCFLTMPYLEGRPLADFTGRPQPPRKAVEVAAKLAQALAAAHAAGVIHRDLKPGNIMMCPGVGPVVMDFGLARQTRQLDQRLTQTGTALGTPAYMPPEQVRGALDQMGPASDVYSLAVILFELLTGRLPFEERTAEVFARILTTEAPPPSALHPGLSPVLDAICRKALAKAPADRYPTMKAFASALIDYLRVTPASAGAGNLVAKNPRPAGVFEAETVPPTREPGEARPPWGGGLPVATLVEDAPATAPRRGAETQPALPQATLVAGPGEKKGGWPWGLLLGCGVGALLLVLGGVGGVAALVLALRSKAEPSSPAAASAAAAARPGEPRVLIDEDFRTPYEKHLAVPDGWEGDAFRVVKDNELYGLEVSKPSGVHFVKLPPLTLSGNFSIEGAYIMGHPAFANYHALTISLENRKRSALLPVVFDWEGKVVIANDPRLPPPSYKPLLPTQFLLKREGKRLRVFLNKDPVADKDLEEVVEYDTLRLGLTGGPGNSGRLARLYGLKVATLAP